MMLELLQAAMALARLRWESRAAEWGTRALDDHMRRDIGLPPRHSALRSQRPDWH